MDLSPKRLSACGGALLFRRERPIWCAICANRRTELEAEPAAIGGIDNVLLDLPGVLRVAVLLARVQGPGQGAGVSSLRPGAWTLGRRVSSHLTRTATRKFWSSLAGAGSDPAASITAGTYRSSLATEVLGLPAARTVVLEGKALWYYACPRACPRACPAADAANAILKYPVDLPCTCRFKQTQRYFGYYSCTTQYIEFSERTEHFTSENSPLF